MKSTKYVSIYSLVKLIKKFRTDSQVNLVVCGRYAFSAKVERMIIEGNLNEVQDFKELPMEVLKLLSFHFNTRWSQKTDSWFFKLRSF